MRYVRLQLTLLAVSLCLLMVHCGLAKTSDNPYSGVLTFHNDNGRTGQNLGETTLTPANVNQAKFGKIFDAPIDGRVYAQPLYVSQVPIPNKGTHNVVYVATQHDTVFAFDADGLSAEPLWMVSLATGSGVSSIPPEVVGTEIGISSTPVIDGTTGTMYVVAATKENGNYFHRLHALDITTGAEKFGGPVAIQASVAGTGVASSGGKIDFQPVIQFQRAALLLSKGAIFIAWGAFNDLGPYHGWVMAYDAATLNQVGVWNDTPNGERGGIWLANCGLSADSDGNVYVLTGNGTFDADSNGIDYGDSFVKLNLTASGLAVSDSFTPFNQYELWQNDNDLGSTGLVLIPDVSGPIAHLGITAGKEGRIYLVNMDDMGKYQPGSDSQIVQSIPDAVGSTPNARNLSTAVYWNGNIYFAGHNDFLRQFKLVNGQVTAGSQSSYGFGYAAASSLSADGNKDGILWSSESGADLLHAYDANDVATELYNSGQAGTRDAFGPIEHFNPPTVANGKVYVAGKTDFAIFGLLP
ncbi:MAG TPA: pyrrolo-quinoline quinone [Terriglobales bacterium]|nr:pyrrolo-quinoline quinone [Terriglobales bacterium]